MIIKPLVLDYRDASAIPGSEFRKLVDENQLVLLNNVDFRSKLDLIKFATTVGNPLRYSVVKTDNRSFNSIEDSLVRTVRYNFKEEVVGNTVYTGLSTWHIDTKWTGAQELVRYNFLYAHLLPEDRTVGRTTYCHTPSLLNDLDSEELEYLRTLTVEHLRTKSSRMFASGLVGYKVADTTEEFHCRSDPLIQRDECGREYLFISPQDVWRITGIDMDQSTLLLNRLQDLIKDPKYHYTHCWNPGQMLASVNLYFPHMVSADFNVDKREMWRIWTK